MNTRKAPVYGAGVLTIAAAMAGPAYGAATAPDDSDTLQEVVVTGEREAMRDSIAAKRNSELIGDDISTKDIGELPDVTIAEELNRLPGVNTLRDRGNSSQASIRGLGPRLVLGLVDGREVASSEPSQDLRWEIYPSEVLSGAQVYKTQDASLVAGGIAATVDIRTISPLDYNGPAFSLRAGPTYNDESKGLPDYSGVGYRASGGVIKHITDDVAFSVAASAQREKNGFPDFRTWGWNTPYNSGPNTTSSTGSNTGSLTGNGVPDNTNYGLNPEIKEITQDRYALAAALAWNAGDNVTMKLDSLWSQYHIDENQFQAWYGNNILGNYDGANASVYNAPGSSYQIANGTVVGVNLNGAYPDYENELAHYSERHTLIATGFNVDWKPGKWDNQADLSFSEAWRNNEWQAIYLSDVYPPNLVYNIGAGGVPYATTPGYDPAAPSIQSIGGYRQNSGSNVQGTGEVTGPEITRDRLSALTLTFGRTLEHSILSGVQFGTRLSDREKTHHEDQWGLCPGTGSTSFTIPGDQNAQVCPAGTAGEGSNPVISLANAGLSQFYAPSFTAPPLVYGNFNSLYSMVYPNSSAPYGSDMPLERTAVNEKTYEGWFRLDFSSSLADMPLNGDLGVRVVRTNTSSSGFQSYDNGVTFSPIEISNDYTDVLPSLNATLHLTQDQLLRFGASIGIARPPLDSLTTGFTLSNTGNPRTGGGGNPKLDPFKADQLDLSYEFYFHEESLFALAPFYKDVKTYIGASQSAETINGVPYIITSENNTRGGEIGGVEATFQTRFYFLPGFLQDFGVYANHAQVESNIHEAAPQPNPYPMVGLARGTSEGDLFYNKLGFEARVAVKHHTAYTVVPTWVGTALQQLAAETTLDASLAYTFTSPWTSSSQWTVRLQGHNLNNERARFTNDNNPENLGNNEGYQVYGRSYLFDIGVRF